MAQADPPNLDRLPAEGRAGCLARPPARPFFLQRPEAPLDRLGFSTNRPADLAFGRLRER